MFRRFNIRLVVALFFLLSACCCGASAELYAGNAGDAVTPSKRRFFSWTTQSAAVRDKLKPSPWIAQRGGGLFGENQTSVLGSGVLISPHRIMDAYRISPIPNPEGKGMIMTAEPVVTTKNALGKKLECALRDLRIIDHVCRRTGPAFLPRNNGIIVHVGHVRAIIERDSVLIFLPREESDSQEQRHSSGDIFVTDGGEFDNLHASYILSELVEALVLHLNNIFGPEGSNALPNENRLILRDAQSILLSRESYKDQPFEVVVLEAILGYICTFQKKKATHLVTKANTLLSAILPNSSSPNRSDRNGFKDSFMELHARLGELLPLKNQIDQLEAECVDISSAISEILRNDDDMFAMVLSRAANKKRRANPIQGAKPIELLFEDNLLQIDEVIGSLRTVQSNVRNTEEVVEIELDLVRNKIMRFELILEMTSLVVGSGALITGLFGMNLVSHLEEHVQMFYYTSAFIVILMVGTGFNLRNKMFADNIL